MRRFTLETKKHVNKPSRAAVLFSYLTLQMSPFLQLLNKSYASMLASVWSVLCDALRRPVYRTGERWFRVESDTARWTQRKLTDSLEQFVHNI